LELELELEHLKTKYELIIQHKTTEIATKDNEIQTMVAMVAQTQEKTQKNQEKINKSQIDAQRAAQIQEQLHSETLVRMQLLEEELYLLKSQHQTQSTISTSADTIQNEQNNQNNQNKLELELELAECKKRIEIECEEYKAGVDVLMHEVSGIWYILYVYYVDYILHTIYYIL